MSFDQLVEAHHQLGMSNAVELALQRDASAARALMDDHIHKSYEVALARYQQHA